MWQKNLKSAKKRKQLVWILANPRYSFKFTRAKGSRALFWSKFVCCLLGCHCHNLFAFSTSSPELLCQFLPNLAQSILVQRTLTFEIKMIKDQPCFPVETTIRKNENRLGCLGCFDNLLKTKLPCENFWHIHVYS